MLNNRMIAALLLILASQFAGAASSYEEMIDAVKQDKTEIVSSLLKRGFDPNSSDREGNTLLMMAAKAGSNGVVKQLLAARAKVLSVNEFGETALMMAAIGGHVDIARSLLERGAVLNRPGWTPLMYAATNGHINVARLLISYGAQVNAVADNGISALMMAEFRTRSLAYRSRSR